MIKVIILSWCLIAQIYGAAAFQPCSQSSPRVTSPVANPSSPELSNTPFASQSSCVRSHHHRYFKLDLSTNSQSTHSLVDGKDRLLRAVSSGDRLEILRAARDLEGLPSNKPDATKVGGRWSLVFSTQTDPIAGIGGADDDSIVDSVNAALYRFFFKFAPFLAGAQERRRNKSGGREGKEAEEGRIDTKEKSSLPGATVSNEQLVDMQTLGVDNRVALRLGGPSGPRAEIRVIGDLIGDDPLDLGVMFTSFSLKIPPGPKVDVPLPRPVGRLRTTYCDSDLRLSRGGRGGLFVLKRITDQK